MCAWRAQTPASPSGRRGLLWQRTSLQEKHRSEEALLSAFTMPSASRSSMTSVAVLSQSSTFVARSASEMVLLGKLPIQDLQTPTWSFTLTVQVCSKVSCNEDGLHMPKLMLYSASEQASGRCGEAQSSVSSVDVVGSFEAEAEAVWAKSALPCMLSSGMLTYEMQLSGLETGTV
eukprot:CAMPEP_0183530116 /NCGR_PEP_ID=MMETSP0371-20130417/23892_1 /TAXON_ID=268820 /ORGANISM="Peridinium aciculiferum, Strain PAER-2" /LENGTH=174 /DNA_ID=CAMNT_0025729961 /DNA_START=185 /DNA_END=709 /DNA_ORIENTATION=+